MYSDATCRSWRADLLPTFSSEAFTPKYVVALESADTQDVGLEGVLPMKDKYGRSYSCIIPGVSSHDKQGQRESPLKVCHVSLHPQAPETNHMSQHPITVVLG